MRKNNFAQSVWAILLAILALAWQGCSGQNGETNSNSLANRYTLAITDQRLTLAIDSTTPNHVPFLSLYTDPAGQEHLACLSPAKGQQGHTLIFSLASQLLAKRIPFAVEGPDGLGQVSGFYLRDRDQVYVASSSLLAISLVDQSGRVKQRINYGKTNDGQATFPAIVSPNNPMMTGPGRLLLPVLPDGNWTFMT